MRIIQDGKKSIPIRSDAYFPDWKPAFTVIELLLPSDVVIRYLHWPRIEVYCNEASYPLFFFSWHMYHAAIYQTQRGDITRTELHEQNNTSLQNGRQSLRIKIGFPTSYKRQDCVHCTRPGVFMENLLSELSVANVRTIQ